MDPTRSGLMTTEFWLHLGAQALAALVALHMLTAEQASLAESVAAKLVAAATAAFALWNAVRYADARTAVKINALEAGITPAPAAPQPGAKPGSPEPPAPAPESTPANPHN